MKSKVREDKRKHDRKTDIDVDQVQDRKRGQINRQQKKRKGNFSKQKKSKGNFPKTKSPTIKKEPTTASRCPK